MFTGRKQEPYIKKSPITENAEKGVNMALTGEIESCSNMATRRQHSSGVSEITAKLLNTVR